MLTFKNNKVVISIFFIILILIVNIYLNSLNKQYLILVKDINHFDKLSNDFIYFEDFEYNTTSSLIGSLLKDIAEQEKKIIYHFDKFYLISNSIVSENEINKIFQRYEVNTLPYLIKLNNGLIERKFEIGSQEVIGKETLRTFITNVKFPTSYAPQYTIIIILFIISILLIIFLFKNNIKSRLNYSNILFTVFMIILSNVLLLILSILSSATYIDNHLLSGDSRISIIFISSLILNLISFMRLAFVYKFK